MELNNNIFFETIQQYNNNVNPHFLDLFIWWQEMATYNQSIQFTSLSSAAYHKESMDDFKLVFPLNTLTIEKVQISPKSIVFSYLQYKYG